MEVWIMKSALMIHSALLASLCCVFLTAGCANTSLKMSVEEIQDLSPDEGVIVGSFLIQGGKDILGRTEWQLEARELNSGPTSPYYYIEADRGKGAEFYAAKMPAGRYWFYAFQQTGFSNAVVPIEARFTVKPGEVTYIGRLEVNFRPGLITAFEPIRWAVKDCKEEDLDAVQAIYEFSFDDVADGLMVAY